ncbi:NAD(+) diphosphatase [Sinomonas sp. ASV322]|uniref:NAD(+) diphosphatase n=1 Tax=Sinomonas sp. ASV322 TaxID=3041920 RepID=UPI0027DBD98F|nr:NAD(+) diphosphatase [Sinomonas sp. ASV322]MDQ4503301.1 NAD(+) diphosphatase [Sinomonas sp. ASV322]
MTSAPDSLPAASHDAAAQGIATVGYAAGNGTHPVAGALAPTLLPVLPAALDRRSEARADESFLPGVLRGERTVAVLMAQRRAAMHGDRLVLLPVKGLPDAWLAGLVVYLGRVPHESGFERSAGADVVLVVLPEPVEPIAGVMSEPADPGAELLPDGTHWSGFREVGGAMHPFEAGIVLEANAIANWHESHPLCPRCGTPTDVVMGGWVRRCPRDGSEHFPRTDPAIIVTVVGPDGRVLLGHGARMRPTMYSTLAGFVEPGESLEQAVIREIAEEVGVRVTECQYLGSQPWPFPASLMLGFTARTEDAEARPDGEEVLDARWFDRAELAAAVSSGEISLPSQASISRALIEHWNGGPIVEPAGDSVRA